MREGACAHQLRNLCRKGCHRCNSLLQGAHSLLAGSGPWGRPSRTHRTGPTQRLLKAGLDALQSSGIGGALPDLHAPLVCASDQDAWVRVRPGWQAHMMASKLRRCQTIGCHCCSPLVIPPAKLSMLASRGEAHPCPDGGGPTQALLTCGCDTRYTKRVSRLTIRSEKGKGQQLHRAQVQLAKAA